jgi:hypothetical protein
MDYTHLERRGPFLIAPNINGRTIRGVLHPDDKWRWFVSIRGPTVKDAHFHLLHLAGNTLAEAQDLATKLGPLPEQGDETEKAGSLTSSSDMGYPESLKRGQQ